MLLESDSARAFLKEELARRMRANPRYSQRAFARQLGISPGELSEVMNGKRHLSLKSALKIAKQLQLSPVEAQHLVQLTQVEKSRSLAGSSLLEPEAHTPLHERQISIDLFRVVSDWYCFAILNFADCEDFSWKPEWIARRLGISVPEAKLALERLERVGLIERLDPSGRTPLYRVVQDYVLSPAGIPSEAIRNYHRQILALAEQALETQDLAERELTGVGFAIDPKHLPALKKEISDFQDKMAAKYSKGRCKEVYHLETALFRLTQPQPQAQKPVTRKSPSSPARGTNL